MRTTNKLLIAMAAILVGVSGCSQLRSRRGASLDEAVRQVELAPPAVSEFKKANANEPVRLGDASKSKPSETAAIASRKPEAAPSKVASVAGSESNRSAPDGDFVIGKKITTSQPVKAAATAESSKAETESLPESGIANTEVSTESNELAKSLPAPSLTPGKTTASLPAALPPAPTIKSTLNDSSSVNDAAVVSNDLPVAGKKIPHAVAKQRDLASLPPAVADGVSIHGDAVVKNEPPTIAKVEAAKKEDAPVVAIAAPGSSEAASTPPAIVPAVAEIASKNGAAPTSERVDPLVKPVSGVEESLPTPSAVPTGNLPSVLPAATTELPAVVTTPAQETPAVAEMPPMPEKSPEKKIVTVMEVAAKAPIAPAIAAVPDTRSTNASSQQAGSLETDRLHLCTEIIGFGKTVLRETEAVAPGERCLAYLEVRNFASKQTDQEFETKLGCDLSLENAAGQTVFNQTFPDIVDKCVTPRRDFFCHFLFSMPTTVLPGKYKLRIRIVDRTNSSTSEAVADVLVGSKGASPSVSDNETSTKRSIELGDSLSTPNQLGNSEGNKSKGLDQS